MKGIQNTTTSNFGSLIGNGRRYIVPKFQRDYSWDSEQWDDLWVDIDKMISENGDHYMGYLVLQTTNNKEYLIIDGQQRFTTITLIILAAIKSIQKLIDRGEDVEENEKRKQSLLNTYIGNIDPVTLEYDNLLVLNRNNNGYYKEYIVKLGELRTRNTSSTEKLMKRCFEWYERELNSKFNSGREYAQFITTLVDNLFFTIITVNDEMNAFRVFETLNARGVQLSSSDLLKNYLFSLVDSNAQHPGRIDTLEDKWSVLTRNIRAEKLPDFVRYYWNSKNKTVRANELFKAIRDDIRTDIQVFEIINEMIVYSDIYMALKNHDDEYWEGNQIICHQIELLNMFGLKQPYSLLMAAKVNLPENLFIEVLKDVTILGFRYNVICGKNPNDIERVFNEIAIKITREKIYPKALLKKVYVDDQEFVGMFNTKSMVNNSRNNKIIKYILGKLNKHNGGQREVDLYSETDTIEHILPQNPDDNWQIDEDTAERLVYRLGNQCLLEKSLNKNLGNSEYSVKKEIYKESSFKDTKDIAENYDRWDKNAINSRQSKMGRTAKAIWKIDF